VRDIGALPPVLREAGKAAKNERNLRDVNDRN
jgi:hypothetical protein